MVRFWLKSAYLTAPISDRFSHQRFRGQIRIVSSVVFKDFPRKPTDSSNNDPGWQRFAIPSFDRFAIRTEDGTKETWTNRALSRPHFLAVSNKFWK